MSLRNVMIIFRKDLFDAIRDARVLLALIVPFGIAILYNFMFDDEIPLLSVTVAYVETGSTLPERIEESVGDSVRLQLREYPSVDAVRQAVADDDAGVGLGIPDGFDRAVEAGESPPLAIILPESPGVGTNFVVRSIEESVARMAGQTPAAAFQYETSIPDEPSGPAPVETVGFRQFFLLAALMMLIGMISMLAVPMILAEESEKKTLEALTLVASYVDVVVAKALVGLVYLVLGTGLLLGLTRMWPEDPLVFATGVLLLGVVLVGIGLLIGGLFRSASQLNNWGGVLILPVIAPAFIVGVWGPGILEYVIEAMPVAQGMKLAVNGIAGEAVFERVWLAYLILGFWVVAVYSMLVVRLSRMQT